MRSQFPDEQSSLESAVSMEFLFNSHFPSCSKKFVDLQKAFAEHRCKHDILDLVLYDPMTDPLSLQPCFNDGNCIYLHSGSRDIRASIRTIPKLRDTSLQDEN